MVRVACIGSGATLTRLGSSSGHESVFLEEVGDGNTSPETEDAADVAVVSRSESGHLGHGVPALRASSQSRSVGRLL